MTITPQLNFPKGMISICNGFFYLFFSECPVIEDGHKMGFSMKLRYLTCPLSKLGFVSDAELIKYRKTKAYRNTFLSFIYTQKR